MAEGPRRENRGSHLLNQFKDVSEAQAHGPIARPTRGRCWRGCGGGVGGGCGGVLVVVRSPSATLLSIIAMTNTTIGNLSEGLITQLSCRKTLTHRCHPCSEHHPKAWRWLGWVGWIGLGLSGVVSPRPSRHPSRSPTAPSATRTDSARLLTVHAPTSAGWPAVLGHSQEGALSTRQAGRGPRQGAHLLVPSNPSPSYFVSCCVVRVPRPHGAVPDSRERPCGSVVASTTCAVLCCAVLYHEHEIREDDDNLCCLPLETGGTRYL